MADGSEKAVSNDSLNSKEVEKPQIQPIGLPTVEEIRGQDIWNNCAVRSVVSGVMGMIIELYLKLKLMFSKYLYNFGVSFQGFQM